jgi:hypothetical protein
MEVAKVQNCAVEPQDKNNGKIPPLLYIYIYILADSPALPGYIVVSRCELS